MLQRFGLSRCLAYDTFHVYVYPSDNSSKIFIIYQLKFEILIAIVSYLIVIIAHIQMIRIMILVLIQAVLSLFMPAQTVNDSFALMQHNSSVNVISNIQT
uniref:Uncharacterized protein n=1 Tax=Onchocerca volvulus TaxID=6282 RepID=A0A8R1XT75_ONCVO